MDLGLSGIPFHILKGHFQVNLPFRIPLRVAHTTESSVVSLSESEKRPMKGRLEENSSSEYHLEIEFGF